MKLRWIAHLIFIVSNNEDIRSRTNMECCPYDIKSTDETEKDRGNFSNLVSESLFSAIILLLPEFLYSHLLSSALSPSVSLYRVILCSKQQDIGWIDAPYLLQKIFPKGEHGGWVLRPVYQFRSIPLPLRVFTKDKSHLTPLADGVLEGTARVSYRIAQMINRYRLNASYRLARESTSNFPFERPRNINIEGGRREVGNGSSTRVCSRLTRGQERIV